MNTQKTQDQHSGKSESKWLQINQMLVQMVDWNFLYRLKPTGNTNNFNTIATGLNLLAEELLQYFYNHNSVYQLDSTKFLLNSFFILDKRGIVLQATDEGCALLDRMKDSIVNKPISDFMAGNTKVHWARNFTTLCNSGKLNTMPKALDFMGQDESVNTFLCRIQSYDEPMDSSKLVLVNLIPIHKIKGLKVADHRIVLDPRTDLRKKMGKKLKYPINLTH